MGGTNGTAANGQANGNHEYMTPQQKLRKQLFTEGESVWAPGVFDGVSARLAIRAGCDALYMSGACVSASRLGLPDIAFASQDDFVNTIAMINQLDPTMPIIADADTGFGGMNQVARTIRRYHQAGAAALHLEDQVTEKRCGHIGGKVVVSREEFWMRIRAAIKARNEIPGGSDMVIIARTDSKQQHGLEEAIIRLHGAVKEGADCIFLEGVDNLEDYVRLVKEFHPIPVKSSINQGGHAPKNTYKEFKDIGVRMVTLPALGIDAATYAMKKAYEYGREYGTDIGSAQPGMVPMELFRKLLGYEQFVKFEADVGSTHFAEGSF